MVLAGYAPTSNSSSSTNTTNYLYTNSYYWTMSPNTFNTSGAAVLIYITNQGYISTGFAWNANSVRPVISLANSALVESTGDGSTTNPYNVLLSTVKFVTGTNDKINDIKIYDTSTKISEPSELTKEGYEFDGWYTDSEYTSEYDFNSTVTKNTTLYAKWNRDYTYKFIDKNENYKNIDDQTFVVSKVDEYIIKVDGDYTLFDSLKINSVEFEKDKDYKVTEGSTIITFTEEGLSKLNKLEVNSYNVEVTYTNGIKVTGKLNIVEGDKNTNPKTYDGITTWIILALVSTICLASLLFVKKIKRK